MTQTRLLGNSNGGTDTVIMSQTYSPERDAGVSAESDGAFNATLVGANPADTWFFMLAAQQFANITTQTIIFKVMVDYTVKFTDLKGQVMN